MGVDLCVLSKVRIKGELSKRGGPELPGRASVFPEPPGAKTASHALKRDFAPDDSCLFHNWFGLHGLFFVDDLGNVLLRLPCFTLLNEVGNNVD